jgi:hypothetical protein
VTNNSASFPFGQPLAAHIDADGFGYFVANARNLQRIGVFKVQLSDTSDMEVVAFGLLPAASLSERIYSAAGGGEAGIFDATHGYLVTGNNSSADVGVSKFALADITNTDLTTIHATGTTVTTTSVDLKQSGHLSATERVCALVADDDHLYAASCVFRSSDPSGRVTKVKKSDLSLVSTTEVTTPSQIVSAVVDGSDAFFIGARVAKVTTATMAVDSSTTLCSGENVRASVLAPGGDLLLNVRVSTGAIARVVRVGAGARADCPGGSVTTGGGGGDDPAVDVPVAAAVAAASAAGVAGSSSAVLVRGGEVVPVTSSSAAGAGPRGGVVLEAEGLKVTVAAAGGASPQTGVVAPVGGEIVCELCAAFAAGSTIEAWMYSSPQLAAAVQVPDDHEDGECILLRIPTGAPLAGEPVAAGVHTLQLRMYVQDGLEVLATGVTVGTAVPSGIPAGDGPVDRGLLGMFGLLAVAGAVAVRRLVVTG